MSGQGLSGEVRSRPVSPGSSGPTAPGAKPARMAKPERTTRTGGPALVAFVLLGLSPASHQDRRRPSRSGGEVPNDSADHSSTRPRLRATTGRPPGTRRPSSPRTGSSGGPPRGSAAMPVGEDHGLVGLGPRTTPPRSPGRRGRGRARSRVPTRRGSERRRQERGGGRLDLLVRTSARRPRRRAPNSGSRAHGPRRASRERVEGQNEDAVALVFGEPRRFDHAAPRAHQGERSRALGATRARGSRPERTGYGPHPQALSADPGAARLELRGSVPPRGDPAARRGSSGPRSKRDNSPRM